MKIQNHLHFVVNNLVSFVSFIVQLILAVKYWALIVQKFLVVALVKNVKMKKYMVPQIIIQKQIR